MRALLVALDAWVSNGVLPPESRIPTRKENSLVSVKGTVAQFPKIPGVEHIQQANPTFVRLGNVTARSPQTEYASLVPKTDVDGNDLGGIRLPDITVPLGSHTGWAVRADAPGAMCGNLGQFIPFAKTKAERNAARDPRLSLAERYPKATTYVDQISQAAKDLQAQRLLLPEDVDAYMTDSAQKAAAILAPPPKPPQTKAQRAASGDSRGGRKTER
jgi:hypothetical protein